MMTSAPGLPEKISTVPARAKVALHAAWAEPLVGKNGCKLVAEKEYYDRAELRCVNEHAFQPQGHSRLKKLNSERKMGAESICVYAFEDVILLPHGALLIGDEIIEETIVHVPDDPFMREIAEYYDQVDLRGSENPDIGLMQIPLLIVEQPGLFNYGYFLVEIFPKLGPFLDQLRDGSVRVALPAPYRYHGHVTGMFAYLGLKVDDVVWFDIGKDAPWQFIRVPKVLFVSPISRHLDPSYKSPWSIRMLGEMTADIKPGSQKKIFISRQDAGLRFLLNEDQIFSALEPLGYERVRVGGMTFVEQVATFRGATHIVGVYGASLSNIVFCEHMTKILTICPNNFVDHFYWDLACHREILYTQIVGPPVDGQETIFHCDFEVNQHDLLNAVTNL